MAPLRIDQPWRCLPRSLALLATFAAGACGGASTAPVPPGARSATVSFWPPIVALPRPRTAGRIQHVVIIVQENRSFDNLFNQYPGARVVHRGKIHTGAVVPLTPLDLNQDTGTQHMYVDFLTAYDGRRMDGFDLNTETPSPNLLAYTYVPAAEVGPYYEMAQQYVLADNFFTSHIDASFVGHQYLIAAQANHSVNLPTGSWGCHNDANDFIPVLSRERTTISWESPCFMYTTLADELDAAGLTWRYYAPLISCSHSNPHCADQGGVWSAYQAVNQIYNGPDWAKDVISPETRVLEDIENGTLENVTWVVPSFRNSDHPGSGSRTGPMWVASIVNAVGESRFWSSTIVFITWDEWGGEYDHVPPPYKDYDGDGFRVPLLCISPYAYKGALNHTELESAGIPKFVEKTFGLATLADADARAAPADTGCTNPQQTKARAFTPIGSPLGSNYFLHVQRRSDVPPDDS